MKNPTKRHVEMTFRMKSRNEINSKMIRKPKNWKSFRNMKNLFP